MMTAAPKSISGRLTFAGVAWLVLTLTGLEPPAQGASSPETVAWFQKTEQAMADAIADGDKKVWEAVMDPTFAFTTEEGEVLNNQAFLKDLRPLPAGLSGKIVIRELTVQEFDNTAVVRYLLDETEKVFGQHIATKYRDTDTFRKVAGSWKLMAAHTSVVTADPTPPQHVVTKEWPRFVGSYRLLPDGWTYTVKLENGKLYAGRDPAKLKLLVPLAENAFVLSGSLGDLVFATDAQGQVDRIVEIRKFEILIWSRVKT